jgi:TRAP-type C4-dicarboxylate transport system permease small subunit
MKGGRQQAKRIIDLIVSSSTRLGMALAGLATIVMVFIVLSEVVGRFFFAAPTPWAHEYTGYLVAAVTFLGAAYALRSDALIRVTVFTERLSARPQLIVGRIVAAVSLVAILVIAYYATEYYLDTLLAGRRSGTPQRVPLAIPRFVMFLGVWMLIPEMVREIVSPTRAAEEGGLAAASSGTEADPE